MLSLIKPMKVFNSLSISFKSLHIFISTKRSIKFECNFISPLGISLFSFMNILLDLLAKCIANIDSYYGHYSIHKNITHCELC